MKSIAPTWLIFAIPLAFARQALAPAETTMSKVAAIRGDAVVSTLVLVRASRKRRKFPNRVEDFEMLISVPPRLAFHGFALPISG
jgi:hypothetical protein